MKTATKKKTATKAPVKKKTTALAKREPKKQADVSLMPAKAKESVAVATVLPPTVRKLDDDIDLGDLGLVEMRFTPEEEAVLSQPFGVEEVRIRPDGIVYVPHANYTRKLNAAFGRTGWQLVPASKPRLGNDTVVVPYKLHVHGKPIAFGYGEQEFFGERNKGQSFGDAIESTNASGLRRCCKRIGIGLELWDPEFGEAYKAEYCVCVEVEVKFKGEKERKWWWRRRAATPFWNEIGKGSHRGQDREPAREQAPVAHFANASGPIGEPKIQKFWTTARKRGRSEQEIRDYLQSTYKIASTRDITHAQYDTIMAAIEHPGPLPGAASVIHREPGSDDE